MRRRWNPWAAAWAALLAMALAGMAPAAGGIELPAGEEAFEKRVVELPGGAELTMVWMPEGVLDVEGSTDVEVDLLLRAMQSEEERKTVEAPREMATDGFWIGACEVTQKQWESVMGSHPSYFRGEGLETASLRENLPVECVSWEDCMEFCRRTGLRLPTEMEWLRARNTWSWTSRPWSWTAKNSGNQTHPVGRSNGGVAGIFDMDGNVCEWCADWFGPWPKRSTANYAGAAEGTERVVCGGCWCGNEWFDQQLREERLSLPPECRYNSIGFRVCLGELVNSKNSK